MFASKSATAFKRIGFGACVALALAMLQPAASHAQVTWDANTGTSGPQDGSGTWSTADANWWDGSTNIVWPNLTTSSAFIGAAGTITASGSLRLNKITFNAPGSGTYTLTGSNTFGADVFTSANVTFRIGGTGAAGGHNEFATTSTAHHESENNS